MHHDEQFLSHFAGSLIFFTFQPREVRREKGKKNCETEGRESSPLSLRLSLFWLCFIMLRSLASVAGKKKVRGSAEEIGNSHLLLHFLPPLAPPPPPHDPLSSLIRSCPKGSAKTGLDSERDPPSASDHEGSLSFSDLFLLTRLLFSFLSLLSLLSPQLYVYPSFAHSPSHFPLPPSPSLLTTHSFLRSKIHTKNSFLRFNSKLILSTA